MFVAAGVRNVTALGNLISWQKVDYDFNYHQMEFPCNINVLIASEGRSLLPVRTQWKLTPTHCWSLPAPSPRSPPPATARGGVRFPPVSHEAEPCQTLVVVSSRRHAVVSADIGRLQAGGFNQSLAVLRTAWGMCCVLFLCAGLMGCHGGSCVPREQSRERRQARPAIRRAVKGSVL